MVGNARQSNLKIETPKSKTFGVFVYDVQTGTAGFARLQSRLRIHVDPEAVLISTPLDKYESDVYELAEVLAKETGLDYSKKKNRVIFPKDDRLLKVLGIKE